MTEVLEIKIAAIFVIFAIAAAGGMLPRRVGKLERADVWFSLSNAFAGGLFLAVGLIHMAGDAGEHFEEAGVDFNPNPELLLATGGFLLVLLLEMWPEAGCVRERPSPDRSDRAKVPTTTLRRGRPAQTRPSALASSRCSYRSTRS